MLSAHYVTINYKRPYSTAVHLLQSYCHCSSFTTIILSVQFIVLHSVRNLQQTSLFLLLYAFTYSNYVSIGHVLFISYDMHQIRKAQKGKQTNAYRVLVRKPEGRSH